MSKKNPFVYVIGGVAVGYLMLSDEQKEVVTETIAGGTNTITNTLKELVPFEVPKLAELNIPKLDFDFDTSMFESPIDKIKSGVSNVVDKIPSASSIGGGANNIITDLFTGFVSGGKSASKSFKSSSIPSRISSNINVIKQASWENQGFSIKESKSLVNAPVREQVTQAVTKAVTGKSARPSFIEKSYTDRIKDNIGSVSKIIKGWF